MLKMKFKEGDVVLFDWGENEDPSFFSKQIEKYNLREYGESHATHAGIIAEVNKDSVKVFEIVEYKEPGFYVYENSWLENAIEEGIVKIERATVKLSNVYENCLKYAETHYSIMDILSIYFYGFTGIKLSLSGKKAVICSELTTRILYDSSNKKINFEKEFDKSFDLITPMDIYLSKQLKEVK